MKRKKEHEKDKFPLEHVPVKFLKKPHQKKFLRRLERKEENHGATRGQMWSSIIRTQGFIDSYYAMSSATRPRFIVALSSSSYVKDHAKRLFIFSGEECSSSSSYVSANLDMTIPSLRLAHGYTCPSVHGFVSCCHGLQFTISLIPVACEYGYDGFIIIRLGGGGGGGAQSRSAVTSPPYRPLSKGLCIDGFLYYGAVTQSETPVIMCFDVRNENISFITTPKDVLHLDRNSVLIEYKGKLAAIVGHCLPFNFRGFDLWILEDVKKHEWSKQTFELPYCLLDMTSPGTNKAGEIIFAPLKLSLDNLRPFFYIVVYNVARKDVRRVRIQGFADDEGFRRHYGLVGFCNVSVSPQHVQSIASL
ncbi:unnamed protein product [Microthlaspi erraticum]|uniref:F-box associated beta-propeller type 3 domain-containing protein n=1 Tax=Microthlaspi erraticum TaxID=1685480 RepID=A0A6D2KFA3_9BRAS|nr:unnamed protein product [Microthlaspi erraticum]